MELLIMCMIGLAGFALAELPVLSNYNKSTDNGGNFSNNFGGNFDGGFDGGESKEYQHAQSLRNHREYLPVGEKVRYPTFNDDASFSQYSGSPYLPPFPSTSAPSTTTSAPTYAPVMNAGAYPGASFSSAEPAYHSGQPSHDVILGDLSFPKPQKFSNYKN